MRPFPEEYELIGFFETEPEVLNPGIPWAFNELIFRTESLNGTLVARMTAGSELLNLEWKQGGEVAAQLDLKGVQSLYVGDGKNGHPINTLVAVFRDPNVSALSVTIRPRITLRWGYNDQR